MATVSLAQAKDTDVAGTADKSAQPANLATITTANDADSQPLDRVPEPTTGSLVLLGLGCAGLAMKLRKRA